MAKAEINQLFDCEVTQFYKIITDYEKYPDFLSEVKKCKVVKNEGKKKLVEFQISVIKTITYRVWITENEGKGLNWEFESGELFKVNNGGWTLSDEAGKTRVVYKIEADFKGFVPGPVAKGLVSVNLPNMMAAYQKRVKQLFHK